MAMTQAISDFLRVKHPDCKGISSCSLRACAIAWRMNAFADTDCNRRADNAVMIADSW
jgi:hypothetical protein